ARKSCCVYRLHVVYPCGLDPRLDAAWVWLVGGPDETVESPQPHPFLCRSYSREAGSRRGLKDLATPHPADGLSALNYVRHQKSLRQPHDRGTPRLESQSGLSLVHCWPR